MAVRLNEKQASIIGKNTNKKQNKKNKYHNDKITVNGIKYDSKKEFERHMCLISIERSGKIKDLRFHDKKDIIILQDDPRITYEPDFCYIENKKFVIEDLKGYQTKEFKIKKKLLAGMIKRGEIDAVLRLTKFKDGNFIIIEEYKKNNSKT